MESLRLSVLLGIKGNFKGSLKSGTARSVLTREYGVIRGVSAGFRDDAWFKSLFHNEP